MNPAKEQQLQHLFQKYDWPEEVYILDEDCNISSYWGTRTEGYPNTVSEWVLFSLANTRDYYYISQYWWSLWYKITSSPYKATNKVSKKLSVYDRVRISHNAIWCYFGYTEGQSDLTLEFFDILSVFKEPLPLLEPTPPPKKTYAKKAVRKATKNTCA